MKIQKKCYICKEKFENKYLKDKKHRKFVIIQENTVAAHRIWDLKYSVLKKIPILFHNGSNYVYHLIIKELAEEFKKQFTYLGEITEKHVTFTVSIEKRT